jgi:hypothetical protein
MLLKLLAKIGQLVWGQIQQAFALQGIDVDAVEDLRHVRVRLPPFGQRGRERLGPVRILALNHDDHAAGQIFELPTERRIELCVVLPGGDEIQAVAVEF